MATIPTDEQVGNAILKVFSAYNRRPGEWLPDGLLAGQIEKYGCRCDDLRRGFEWLETKGYAEARNRGYVLTESGFASLQMKPDR